jgi:hypothetical protein
LTLIRVWNTALEGNFCMIYVRSSISWLGFNSSRSQSLFFVSGVIRNLMAFLVRSIVPTMKNGSEDGRFVEFKELDRADSLELPWTICWGWIWCEFGKPLGVPKSLCTSGTIKYRHSKYWHCPDAHQTLLSLQRTAWEINSREKRENLCVGCLYCRIRERLGLPDERDEIYPSYFAETWPAFWYCQGNIETGEETTLDFEIRYCRVAQTELEIGEKNSPSNLRNEKIELMNRPPVAQGSVESEERCGFTESTQGAEGESCKWIY